MIGVNPAVSRAIDKVEVSDKEIKMYSKHGILRLIPKSDKIVRVTYTVNDTFSMKETPGIICPQAVSEFECRETAEYYELLTKILTVKVCKKSGSVSFWKGETLLLKERDRAGRQLEKFDVLGLADVKQEVEKIQTADGTKEVVKEAKLEKKGESFHTRTWFDWDRDEDLYGLGQHEEGYGSLRGKTIYLHQANRKIAIPMLVSTKKYGILMDTYSPMIFNDNEAGSYLYTEASPEIDYYFLAGDDMEDVIAGYRQLTGKAMLLPKWAFGYVQSQERYETQEEIVSIAKETRNHKIGIDCVVLDWLSWPDGEWGQKTYDRNRFPHPEEMTKELHENHTHFMISVWPTMSEGTSNHTEFSQAGLLLPESTIYNAFTKEGRDLYWEQISRELWATGTDAWWCDSSEPVTVEWNNWNYTEPSRIYEEYCKEASLRMPAEMTNSFAFFHAQGIYEGQRSELEKGGPKKRVCNLTRSAYTGQQRFGTIMWSGDIDAKWDTLQKQLGAGLNFCASGLPFWTVDDGAFFVKNSDIWYWQGDFDATTEDMGYRELFTRWYQWSCFLPVMRVHGTDCRRELWNFGSEGEMFYDAIVAANRLRYELMPYIYSAAGKAWLKDRSMILPLAFFFPEDRRLRNITDQYMFGDSLMVAPVVQPMYFEKENRAISAEKTREVVFPAGCDWVDFYTGKTYAGGSVAKVEAGIDRIPVFAKAGSIIPCRKAALSTEEQTDDISFKVFPGKDGIAEIYDDAGDGYAFEAGEYTLSTYHWVDEKKELLLETEKGMIPVESEVVIYETC